MVTMKTILNIWLVEVPPLAVEFTQIAIISQVIESISSSTYIPFVASGKLKLNALWGIVTGFSYFVVLYALFKMGSSAIWVQWLYFIFSLISVFILRPYLLHEEVGFTYPEVFKCIWACFKPLLLAGALTYVLELLFGEALWQQIMLFLIVLLVTCISVWVFLEKPMQQYVLNTIRSKLGREK